MIPAGLQMWPKPQIGQRFVVETSNGPDGLLMRLWVRLGIVPAPRVVRSIYEYTGNGFGLVEEDAKPF